MITAFFTLSQVRGAELWLLFWCISLVAYIGIGYKLKVNQTKQGIKNVLIGLLIAEVANDLVWSISYYFNGTLLDYGIGLTYGLCLWIPLLVITLIIVTIQNKKVEK